NGSREEGQPEAEAASRGTSRTPGLLAEPAPQIGELLLHCFERRSARNAAAGKRKVARAFREPGGIKLRGNAAEFLGRELRPRAAPALRFAEDLSGLIVRASKWNAAAREGVGEFRGEESRVLRGAAQTIGVEARLGDGARGNLQHGSNLVVGGKKSLLVFLQVALVARGQALERGEEAHERTDDAASFSADELPGIRILLLRHEAAARSVFLGQSDKGKFLRGEEDKIFGQAREMHGDT